MYTTKHQLPVKTIAAAALAIAMLLVVIISGLSPIAAASSVVGVTSNIADVPSGENLKLTITAQNDGNIHELEIDHSFEGQLPEFSVYADEANPYGSAADKAAFDTAGVTISYSEAENQWIIDLGQAVTDFAKLPANGGSITFYLVLKDVNSAILWGSMSPASAENTFSFDLVNGTGSEVIPPATTTPVIPKVPNTGVSL